MPIDCVYMGHYEDVEGPWQAGWVLSGLRHAVSRKFEREVADHRPPLLVMVPVRDNPTHATMFCVDSYPTADREGHWDVTVDLDSLVVGQKPNLTVHPSINCVGIYHGWLVHGELSDDIGC